MGRPRLIILVRHAESEGNKNRAIHQTTPDHRVKLTEHGQSQARDAGIKLRDLLLPEDTVQFYTSPYRRTRETTQRIIESLGDDWKDKLNVYEEPRIREQDFGNFQNSKDMEKMWGERAAYGHFFYRIPNGESAADAYDRVSSFNESLWRQFADNDCPSVIVLVTHGLMTRVFLMKWYHWSVEYFEDLRNIEHCEFILMRKNEHQKYILENKLRTWSELKAEQEAAIANGELISRTSTQRRFSEGRKKFTVGSNAHSRVITRTTTESNVPLSQALSKATTRTSIGSQLEEDKQRTLDRNDTNCIQEALKENEGKRQNLLTSPTLRVQPPEGQEEEEDPLHVAEYEMSYYRGRDGGGSKSGFNSSDDENEGVDSDFEDKLEKLELEELGHMACAEKLGDINGDDSDCVSREKTPVLKEEIDFKKGEA